MAEVTTLKDCPRYRAPGNIVRSKYTGHYYLICHHPQDKNKLALVSLHNGCFECGVSPQDNNHWEEVSERIVLKNRG